MNIQMLSPEKQFIYHSMSLTIDKAQDIETLKELCKAALFNKLAMEEMVKKLMMENR